MQIFHSPLTVQLRCVELNLISWLFLISLCIVNNFKNFIQKINAGKICFHPQKLHVYSLWAQTYKNKQFVEFGGG